MQPEDGHVVSMSTAECYIAQSNGGHAASNKKHSIFVARDYSKGLIVRFERVYPRELVGLVSRP